MKIFNISDDLIFRNLRKQLKEYKNWYIIKKVQLGDCDGEQNK